MASPSAFIDSNADRVSSSVCLVTKASAKRRTFSWAGERRILTRASDATSGSKLAGALTTRISVSDFRFNFVKMGDMCLPRSGARYQYDDDTVDNLHNGNRYSVRREAEKQGGSD